MLVCLLPVLGWAVWCFCKKSKQSASRDAFEMAVRICTFSHVLLHILWSRACRTSAVSFGSFMRAVTSNLHLIRPIFPALQAASYCSLISERFRQPAASLSTPSASTSGGGRLRWICKCLWLRSTRNGVPVGSSHRLCVYPCCIRQQDAAWKGSSRNFLNQLT